MYKFGQICIIHSSETTSDRSIFFRHCEHRRCSQSLEINVFRQQMHGRSFLSGFSAVGWPSLARIIRIRLPIVVGLNPIDMPICSCDQPMRCISRSRPLLSSAQIRLMWPGQAAGRFPGSAGRHREALQASGALPLSTCEAPFRGIDVLPLPLAPLCDHCIGHIVAL